MSESTQAWIFLIGLIVFFIVLLIVTLVVLFGGGKDEEPKESDKVKESRTATAKEKPVSAEKKTESKKTDIKKRDSKKTETKKVESKKTEANKPEPEESKSVKPIKTGAAKEEPAGEVYDDFDESYDGRDESYDGRDESYEGHDESYEGHDESYDGHDESYDGYDEEYDGEQYDEYEDEVGKTDELKNPDIPAVEPEEEESEDDIFSVPMDEDSIISRIEGDSPSSDEEEDSSDGEKDETPKENYWYNREEVADRPSYRKPEDYYHYFRSAFDSLDELLTEMYDCAYVKTEEIRFIAYGIEPKTIFGNEEMLVDEDAFIEKFKTKKPTMQDGVKIYEKWCGYVDKFLEIIEIHASEDMTEDIKKKLCEYGKSDAKTLIKGK